MESRGIPESIEGKRLPAVAARRVRGPHAARTEAMRSRLLDATTELLAELGFAATTTDRVISRAGVSRGALLHHFPSRLDLMLAAAEHIVDWQLAQHLAVNQGIEDYRVRLFNLIATSWRVNSGPKSLALMQILLASRSDPALAEHLPPFFHRVAQRQNDRTWMVAEKAGVRDRQALLGLAELYRATVRGLTIQQIADPDAAANFEVAKALLDEFTAATLKRLLDVGRAEAAEEQAAVDAVRRARAEAADRNGKA
jgi:AcrR family transcriptional regulator